MTHVMLDLETWGKRPGCDIRSIGACVFDPVSGFVHDGSLGTIRPFYVACDNPEIPTGSPWHKQKTVPARKWNTLHRDPDTVQWWSEQSDDAQSAFAHPVDLRDALSAFTRWIMDVTYPHETGEPVPDNEHINPSPYLRIYAHGPQFDCSILEAAYHVVGLPVPWHYRAPRDTRTVFDLCGVGDHSEWMKQYPVGTAHNALDDAISQARAVCGAMARLRVTHDVLTHRDSWRSAIQEWTDHTRDDNGSGYYTHELTAFDRTFDALAQHPHVER